MLPAEIMRPLRTLRSVQNLEKSQKIAQNMLWLCSNFLRCLHRNCPVSNDFWQNKQAGRVNRKPWIHDLKDNSRKTHKTVLLLFYFRLPSVRLQAG